MNYPHIYNVLLVIGIMLLDRATKYLAIVWLHKPFVLTYFLDFTLVLNRGISWGFFNTNNIVYVVIMRVCIIALIIALYLYMAVCYKKKKPIFAQVAVFTGAASNLIDRFVYGGVIDFIHVHYGAWSWPIFNIADIAIVCGVLWMIFHADTYE